MRFDDSLRTVLAADTASAFGAQSAFRQLVDLMGRRRVTADGAPLERLRALRADVPAAVRAASARALALSDPPASLVALFAEDDPAVAAPILRSARLRDDEWLALLPQIGPAGRGLLRARTGLSPVVRRGLEAFGSTDFTIGHDAPQPVWDSPEPTRPATSEPIALEPRPRGQTFAIADLVGRIETFNRDQEHRAAPVPARPDRFAFETDPAGTIAWIDSPRAGVVGTRLTGIATGATTLRLGGTGELAGEWAIAAVSLFAPETGRFSGYRGTARRIAASARDAIEPEALRRLVHELRTPTNAISGFAELIATGMLGPVAPVHRSRAHAIGREVQSLIGAIDDLDISARVDAGALQLSPRPTDLAAVLDEAIRAAAPDGRMRMVAESGITVFADDRALGRLLARLAELVAESVPAGAQVTVTARSGGNGVAVTWPRTSPGHDGSLLGADFAMRLAHKLALALGGRLLSEPGRLTLHLPSSLNTPVQATTH